MYAPTQLHTHVYNNTEELAAHIEFSDCR
jgi:hypothetical protein